MLGCDVRRDSKGAQQTCSFDLSGDYEGVTIIPHTIRLLPVPVLFYNNKIKTNSLCPYYI